ncbi:MAG: hypothetical protein LUD79_02025 [Oscillospiraceae bacterium]|nr:hypothetical protein [Oscillospiraceae bacterium]
MTIAEQIAHLKGLAEGMEIQSESSKEAKLLTAMLEVLDSIGQQLEQLQEDVEIVNDGVDALSEELMGLEDDYYGEDDDVWTYDGEDDDYEDDDEELDEDEPFYYVVKCPKCGEEMMMDEETLLAGNIRCEACGQLFSLEVVEDDESDDYDEDEDESL